MKVFFLKNKENTVNTWAFIMDHLCALDQFLHPWTFRGLGAIVQFFPQEM